MYAVVCYTDPYHGSRGVGFEYNDKHTEMYRVEGANYATLAEAKRELCKCLWRHDDLLDGYPTLASIRGTVKAHDLDAAVGRDWARYDVYTYRIVKYDGRKVLTRENIF